MSDEKRGFTVKDRRLFTPEGERRAVEAEDEAAPEPRPQERPASLSPARAPASREPAGSAAGEISFASFLMSLAAQAGALLDEGGPQLDGARQIIAILEMLGDKTEGRRTPDEDRVLQGLLYELRLAYVERARMASA